MSGMLTKIISGGQTGADQGGLEAGRKLGLETGGTTPFGWKTERGSQPTLLQSFGLVPNLSPKYPDRTRKNVADSDGTIIFGDFYSPGSRLTVKYCETLFRPVYRVCREDNPIIERKDFLNWLKKNNISTLNVAGNRESKNPGIQKRVVEFLVNALGDTKETTNEEMV